MTARIDDTFMTVMEDNGIVVLRWKKGTERMNDELFKQEALKFVGVVEKELAKKIVVDMRDFRFQLSPELVSWRNEHVIALYNRIELQKFAFISNTPPAVKQEDPANTFTTRHFKTEEEANKWLSAA